MSITFKLWDSSSNFITFEPDYGSPESASRHLNRTRAQQGKLYSHTYGFWRTWDFTISFIPSSAAVFCNSIWLDHSGCQLEIDLDGVSEVYSVFIQNKQLPFSELSTYEAERLKGKLTLTEY